MEALNTKIDPTLVKWDAVDKNKIAWDKIPENDIENIIASKVNELKALEDEYNNFKPASTDESDVLSAAEKYHPSNKDITPDVDIDFDNIF